MQSPTFTAPTFNTGGDFLPCPAGVYPSRLYRIVDMGSQSESFEGKAPVMRRKLLLSFEILDPDVTTEKGEPMTIHRRFTWSMHPQSALRPFLSAWRGKPFSDDEAALFDFGKLLGAAALLNITNVERGGRIRADIASISPLPKGMVPPAGINELTAFHAEHPDLAVLGSLGKKLQESIEASPEYRQAMGEAPARPAPTPAPAARPAPMPRPAATYPAATPDRIPATAAAEGWRLADFDDDIPF